MFLFIFRTNKWHFLSCTYQINLKSNAVESHQIPGGKSRVVYNGVIWYGVAISYGMVWWYYVIWYGGIIWYGVAV